MLKMLLKRAISLSQKQSWWAALWVAWFLLLWRLSSGALPQETPKFEIPHLDKVMHFVYFASGAICATYFFLTKSGNSRKWFVGASVLILGVSVGALDEWHQSWIPERSGNDLLDLLADTLGTFFGLVFAYLTWPLLQKLKA